MADYGLLGVKPIDKHHPATQENKIGFDKIDGQKMFTSDLGNQAMGATQRQSRSGAGANVNAARSGTFRVRRRTLSKG